MRQRGGLTMSLIVAGRFTTFAAAETAVRRLIGNGFVEGDVTLVFLNPQGQHARFPVGGAQYAGFTGIAAGCAKIVGAFR
jgi:hypothetical protein